MKKKLRNATVISFLLVGITCMEPVWAESISLEDLKGFSVENVKPSDKGKAFDKSHWAYKTLQNISQKYGLLVGKPDEKFNGNTPVSRNEAAVILVNLIGKIEEQNLKLSEAEKAKIEILQQELNGEIQKLLGRVTNLELSVTELKGRVSNVEESGKKNWKFNYGENFKVTGGLQANYYANFQRGANPVPDNFSIPYGEITFSGKINEKFDYMARTIPTRQFGGNASKNAIFDDLYIGTNIIPKHYISVGQVRVPFGMEAPMNSLDIDFIEYSQMARNVIIGNNQQFDTGIKADGDFDFVNYKIGAFNGAGQTAAQGNRNMTLVAQANLKPFYSVPKLGNLLIGGSFLSGDRTGSKRHGYGAHASYNLGKLILKSELMNFNKANGYNFDAKYQLTDKLQLLGRWDLYDPNIREGADKTTEYILGINYALAENLLLMINYGFADRQESKDSHRLGILKQVIF